MGTCPASRAPGLHTERNTMKSVRVTSRVEIAGHTLFPGAAIVSDELAAVLVAASALDEAPLDHRSANALDQLVFRGAYGAGVAYVKGDVVTAGGTSFVALTSSTGESTGDTDFFAPLELDTGLNIPVANLAALGATTNIPAVSVTLSTTNVYSDAAVKTAIDSGCNTLRTAVEARLDAAEAKLDAAIAKLVTAGIMAP